MKQLAQEHKVKYIKQLKWAKINLNRDEKDTDIQEELQGIYSNDSAKYA